MAEVSRGHDLVAVLLQSTVAEWIMAFGLVFGGCCSNAWALEVATSQNPHAGSLITFAQFVLVSIYGFRKHITVGRSPTARKDVLRTTAAQIVHLHLRVISNDKSRSAAGRISYVALDGYTSGAFADELAQEIEAVSRALGIRRFSFTGNGKDVAARLRKLWSLDVPQNTVVLVNGAHLHAGDFGARWDCSVFLVSAQDVPVQGTHGYPSLTIDVSSQTHPVILSPVPTGRPLKLLKNLTRVRLKQRSIPISSWAVQVALFLVTSLLNNAAFGYNVPMGVHIIFRSGGLVVNMVMGWLIDGRRYNATQILSVILVTLGVMCTTLSATQSPKSLATTSSWSSTGQYYIGILILTLALILSGFMGLAQDRAYAKYGRGHWQEAMFYLHFLALPGFAFVWRDLVSQIRTVNASTRVEIGLANVFIPVGRGLTQDLLARRISVPSFYFPLMLNVVTQLLCVSGVHRLTSRVNSLTVALVLVVRKAVSLGISVTLVRKSKGSEAFLWTGAGLVLAGTVGYTMGANQKVRNAKRRE